MKRREFLKAGAAAMLAGSSWLRSSRLDAQEPRFGELNGLPGGNPWQPPAGMPNQRPIFRVLEIFLYGGVAPWETFYLNPTTAATAMCAPGMCGTIPGTDSVQWGTYQCQFQALAEADTRRPTGTPITQEFYENIHLGPATWPLWRPDLLDHLQVWVTAHDLLPHEAAVPYSLTGTRLGRPTMAGTAAIVNKSYSGGGVPAAFVLKGTGGTSSDNYIAATAEGRLGAAYKPIYFPLDDVPSDLSELDRTPTPLENDLLRYYLRQYEQRLTWPGAASRTRSRVFSDYEATLQQFFNLQDIAAQIQGFDPTDSSLTFGTESSCSAPFPGVPAPESGIRQALSLATHLLQLPTTRYVCVIDTGRERSFGAGYDTHGSHARVSYRNLSSTLEVIARMTDPSQPGGPRLDPFTAILITTEFGRTPNPEGTTGRGHYPYAYANLFIPPNNAVLPRPARRILGGIDENARVFARFGEDIAAITPTDLRGAMLMALGINPFAQDLFGVGDFSAAVAQGAEQQARANLVRKVLGYEV